MNRNIALIIGVIILAGVLGWVYFGQRSTQPLPAVQDISANIGTEAPAGTGPERATTPPPGANF